MNTLRIIHPGTHAGVQDLGRPGYASSGIAAGGAADTLSLRIGNRIVGNADGAAGIEFAMSGGVLGFERDAVIALCGVDGQPGSVKPRIGGRETALWTPHRVGAGEEVHLGAYTQGARVYVCVRGGVDVPAVLGSRSTYRAGGIGGHDGLGLRAGDSLPIGEEPGTAPRTLSEVALTTVRSAIRRQVLMVTPGPHPGAFTRSLEDLGSQVLCTVGEASDRVGIRIAGLTTGPRRRGSMVSEGTVQGAIQVPDDDLAIILGPDRPTTGGYPVFATVAAVDLPALGQLRPRDRVRLVACSPGESRGLYHERWRLLDAHLPPLPRK